MVFDEDNNPVFPNPSLVSAIDIDFGGALNPGEHRIVHKVLQTANLSANQWWSPFALQLTMEAPDGADISDYVIEVLIDASPFDEDAPFSYNYLIVIRIPGTSTGLRARSPAKITRWFRRL